MSRPKKHASVSSLKISGRILYGSITEVMIKCGKKNCGCHRDPSRRHGPYFQWTGVVRGKRTTIKLSSTSIVQECIQRIKNYELLLKQIERLKEDAINNAPWLIHPP